MRYSVVYFLLVVGILKGIGTSTVNNRSHPELKWSTIKTIHFDVHFHQGIRDIALRGASIAEQVRPILMRQMDLDSLPRLDIVFTSEDEILNGFAMSSNNTIIWIDQNDAALWNGDEKWLRTVLAHELQHLVYFNIVRGPWWLPRPMNILTSGVPAGMWKGWLNILQRNGDLFVMIFHIKDMLSLIMFTKLRILIMMVFQKVYTLLRGLVIQLLAR